MSGDGHKVWWLYGPPCVGKSVTAWALFTHLLNGQPRAYFDIDQVGMCYPEPKDDPGRGALKSRAARALIPRFIRAGARTVIISGVLDDSTVSDLVDNLAGVNVTFCRLRVDTEELTGRLKSRYGPEDVGRALAEAHAWDQRGGTDPVVDTGRGDPVASATRVVQAVSAASAASSSATGPRARAPSCVDAGRRRAVLICGPTAVGKSTAGFGLFRHLRATGSVGAYLDLEQLSFVAGVSVDDASTRHQIVAGCVADLWNEYQSVGAYDLVLTGQIQQPEEVQNYRNALGETPLLVCRLRASTEGLRERLLARAGGGEPALAGDTLIGLSADDTEKVLRDALAQQARFEEVEIADVILDTAGETPGAVEQQLLSVLDRWDPLI